VKNKLLPPQPKPTTQTLPKGILELERFSQENFSQWKKAAENLDEFENVLFHSLEPERKRYRDQILAALAQEKPLTIIENRWARIVNHQYSNAPLSAAGSLHAVGGRFNAGIELDPNTMHAWPALYLAENHETAFREKFQLSKDGNIDGLSAQELALSTKTSFTCVQINIELYRVFDLTNSKSLVTLSKILSKFKPPYRATQLQRALKMPANKSLLLKTPNSLWQNTCEFNWRGRPIQFGLPANSHLLAEWIVATGFEAIVYKSSKGSGRCLAVFPEKLGDHSFVELADPSPDSVTYRRLDANSADALAGWDSVLPKFRPKNAQL
jgi:hypothetical protein